MPVRSYTNAAGDTFTEVTGSVFESMTNDPKEIVSLDFRALVLSALIDRIEEMGWTQAVAARTLGTTQPRVSDLMRGRLSAFSLDTLVDYAARAGLRFHASVSPANAEHSPPPQTEPPQVYVADSADLRIDSPEPGMRRVMSRAASHRGRVLVAEDERGRERGNDYTLTLAA